MRSLIGPGTVLNRAIVLGSDYYESYESITEHEKAGKPRIGIATQAEWSRAPRRSVGVPAGSRTVADSPTCFGVRAS